MGEIGPRLWKFGANELVEQSCSQNVRYFLNLLADNLDGNESRSVIPLGHGDPSPFPAFSTDPAAVEAVCDALRSAKFNHYSTTTGLPLARKAVAEYLSRDLSYQISPDDVYLTAGGQQAIEILTSTLAVPGASILLPRPSYPMYDSRASVSQLEIRHYDLLPEKGWEVDLHALEALADDRTVAMLLINPCNPCGNVFSRQHLQEIAETACKLGVLVIADEIYKNMNFGDTPFVSMAEFAEIVPVMLLGGISKRWFVPGWRFGWIVTLDPHCIMKHSGLVGSLTNVLNLSTDPTTFIQGAIPDILGKTKDYFFSTKLEILRECAETCDKEIKKIPCITCPYKPEASMFTMVKLDLSQLEDISDDLEFCCKLAKEESLIILPGNQSYSLLNEEDNKSDSEHLAGRAVGLKNWLRITFAVEPKLLRDGLARLINFSQRHSKKQP